jgi:5-formyltetrahydrofolate cyclo-ligase
VIPVTPHDVRVDLIATPTRIIRCAGGRRTMPKLDWSQLTEEKIAAIPLLRRLRSGQHE